MFNRLLGRERTGLTLFASAILSLSGMTTFALASDSGRGAGDIDGNVVLKVRQEEILRQFEAASEKEYTLGAGDEIEVEVPGQLDLKGHHIIGPDGRITLPYVGPMDVRGLTREQAASAMEKAWSQYYSTINVTVQVSKYGSNRIVVVGRVSSPGPLYFENAPTLLEALAKSGAYGPRPADSGTTNSIARTNNQPTMISRCAVYRGTEQVLWIDMKELFASGAGVDLHLRRDDVVYVPDEQDDLVSVLGQVQHPGAVRLTADIRLVDVIAMAGGLTDDAASGKIRIVRPSTGMVREVALNNLLYKPLAQNSEISLQRGDVIYVPKSGIGKIGYVLAKFGPAGSLVTIGALAGK